MSWTLDSAGGTCLPSSDASAEVLWPTRGLSPRADLSPNVPRASPGRAPGVQRGGMFPNVRLMIAAVFASIVALICGFGIFAALRVSHEPLVRLPPATAPLQLVADNAAKSSVAFAPGEPFNGRFRSATRRAPSPLRIRLTSPIVTMRPTRARRRDRTAGARHCRSGRNNIRCRRTKGTSGLPVAEATEQPMVGVAVPTRTTRRPLHSRGNRSLHRRQRVTRRWPQHRQMQGPPMQGKK